MKRLLAVVGVVCLLSVRVWAAEAEKGDLPRVPIEADVSNPKAAKIVLVAGKKSHGVGEHEFFKGCAILMRLLEETPDVAVVMAKDNWPENEKIFENAKTIVLYMDGRQIHTLNDPEHLAVIAKQMDKGVGFVNIHYAVDYLKDTAAKGPQAWLGGYYLQDYSINPIWEADFKELPVHPITRGVKPFKIRDEWYYDMVWVPGMKGVTPILTATPPDKTRTTEDTKAHPGRPEVTAWAYERDNGGRSFGFTGAHYYRNWSDENFRRVVVNAILWTAHVKVPKGGANVALDPQDVK